jgi:hypothetical protein
VNNAGTAIPKTFEEATLEEMDRVINIPLRWHEPSLKSPMLAKPILLAKPVEVRSPVSLSVTEVRAIVLRCQRLAEDLLHLGARRF